MFLVRQNVDPRVAHDIPDVTDQDGEDEDTHQPGVNVTHLFFYVRLNQKARLFCNQKYVIVIQSSFLELSRL